MFFQAGVPDLTFNEGVLAFGHATLVSFGSFTDNCLQYVQNSTTPALIISAEQKVRSKNYTWFSTDLTSLHNWSNVYRKDTSFF